MRVTCIMCRAGHKLLAKRTYDLSHEQLVELLPLLSHEQVILFCRHCRHEHAVPLVELLQVDGPYYWVESAVRQNDALFDSTEQVL